jgi:hypothetical protein
LHTFPSGIVEVQSDYTDEADPKNQVTLKGNGISVVATREQFDYSSNKKERLFILTASHVAGGENLKAFSIDEQGVRHPMQIVYKFADSGADVEVLEVEAADPSFKALAKIGTADPKQDRLSGWASGNAYCKLVLNDEYQTKEYRPWTVYSWLKGKQETLSVGSKPIFSEDTDEWKLAAQVIPGMSGSPLIGFEPKGDLYDQRSWRHKGEAFRELNIIRGMVTRVARDFAVSYAVDGDYLAGLIVEGVSKTSKEFDSVWEIEDQWRFRDGITYRHSKLVSEIASHSAISGAIESGGVGGGISHDGGGGGDTSVESSEDIFNRLKVDPGLSVSVDGEAKKMLGIRVSYSGVNLYDCETHPFFPCDFPYYLSYETFKRFEPEISSKDPIGTLSDARQNIGFVSWIPLGEELYPLLLKRLNKNSVPANGVVVKSTNQNAKLILRHDDVSFQIPINGGDRLEFSLNHLGALEDTAPDNAAAKRFLPVITVRSNKGIRYAVDLRDLYLMDLELTYSDKWQNGNGPFYGNLDLSNIATRYYRGPNMELMDLYGAPSISIQKTGDEKSYHRITFTWDQVPNPF